MLLFKLFFVSVTFNLAKIMTILFIIARLCNKVLTSNFSLFF